MNRTRNQRIEQALFRGHSLTLDNPAYCHAVCAITESLVQTDGAPEDLTSKALEVKERFASACVIARESGVAAGLEEFALLMRAHHVEVAFEKHDGDHINPGDMLLRAEGNQSKLLSLERVGLNLLQRMSGIATASRCMQERARRRSPATQIVGTRKTPWGLLDKRALHLGNGGTHRLGLGDAIVIKNNHLALIAAREEDAVPVAIERAWKARAESAFIEVEVRGETAARVAAKTFRRLQEEPAEQYPCLLMLDNMAPGEIGKILNMLHREDLWDHTLIEASGGISEVNVEQYAACGVDAISVGALTHSARALDICQRIS
ncbi:MAG TPA: carboxylating nicotinate-nucleotide diphosphorylase [Candidatus Acidoferrales bacterium]|jgi:nicotinate-nucleotide pyrophosphorylase (carboxylating)|nr:carboxylating nicotinate-nucleotide diphosphorylase [Candidatus Acidoferrales bacterium]